MKKLLQIVLVGICAVYLTACGAHNVEIPTNSAPSVTDTYTVEPTCAQPTEAIQAIEVESVPTTKETSGQDAFRVLTDEVDCWTIMLGETMGTHYFAQFNLDGTISAFTSSATPETGIYDYANGVLQLGICADQTDGGTTTYRYENIAFQYDGEKFVSLEQYPMQSGQGHYVVRSDSSGMFHTLRDRYESSLSIPQESTAPTNALLADGEYYAEIYRDGTSISGNMTYEIFSVLEYVELPDETVRSMKVGDVVALPGYELNIEAMEYSTSGGREEISFNYWEVYCYYIEETNNWRFVGPNDKQMTYTGEIITMLMSESACLIDQRTAWGTGQNVYGEPYSGESGEDAEIFSLKALADYFAYYTGDKEYATITITNGEIVKVLIQYHT